MKHQRVAYTLAAITAAFGVATAENNPCLTQTECDSQRQAMGVANLYVDKNDEYPTKGCFKKGENAFWSPGTDEEVTTADVVGVRERIWCDSVQEREERSEETSSQPAGLASAEDPSDNGAGVAFGSRGAVFVIAAWTAHLVF